MKNIIRNVLLGAGIIFTIFLHGQSFATLDTNGDWSGASDLQVMLRAVEMTTPTPAASVPFIGTFYSAQNPNWPPLPADTANVDSWSLGDNVWLLNDIGFDYDALNQSQAMSRGGMRAMDEESPPGFGDLGTNDDEDEGSLTPVDYGTNLWLTITNIASSTAGLLISNTQPDIEYEIQGNTDLTTSNWNSYGFVLGSEITNWTPTSATATNYPSLFLRVRSWQDSDGSGIPDWWWQQYGIANHDPFVQDPSGDGYNYLDDFNNGFIPGTFHTQQQPETNAPSLVCSFIPGPQGSAILAVSSVPANTVTLRLTRFDRLADDFGNTSYDTNFTISVTTNGLYILSNEMTLPDAYLLGDYYYEEADYYWSVTAVGTNGDLETEFDISQNFVNYEDDPLHSWLVPPYFDGRAQLKQNLIFQLRAATVDAPFHFADIFSPGYSPFLETTNSPNYAASGFYDFNFVAYPNVYSTTWFDPTLPFQKNYQFRNFVFNSAELDSNGQSTNGVSGSYTDGSLPDSLVLDEPAAYQFSFPTVNGATISALMPTNTTQWLVSYPFNSPPYDFVGRVDTGFLGEMGITDSLNYDTYVATFSMAGNAQNIYGLSFLSAKITYGTGSGVGTTILSAGGTVEDATLNILFGGYFYPETTQPQFQTVGYDFWNETFSPNDLFDDANTIQNPLPGMTNFSTSQPSSLLITTVGAPNFFVMGYAKLAVTNGYSGVYGYLGQYFDQAYQIDTNGVVTTNTTGVLSSYGNFFATEPGQVALVTMPDLDTGERGTGVVYCVSMNVDANHDGNMDLTFNGADVTSQSLPMEFWVDNDNDGFSVGQDIKVSSPKDYDYNYDGIRSQRGLEDFARLWICGMPALASSQGYYVTLTCSTISGAPAINLYYAETNGGTLYLTDTNTAQNLVGEGTLGTISPTSPYVFAPNFFDGTNKYFMFQGAGVGEGQFTLTVFQGTNVIAQTSTFIDLHDVKDFYEQAVITNDMSGAISNWTSSIEMTNYAVASALGNDTNIIVFVHGINVDDNYWLIDSDTVFKHLYWAGYQGKFTTVKWPCDFLTPPQPFVISVFNESELKAYKASTALKTYLSDLRTRFPNDRLNLLVHSQGNAVVSEAIEQGAPFDTYILTQGALPANCYDVNATNDPAITAYDTGSNITPEWQPMGYHGIYTNLTGRIANFYNPEDVVLGDWIYDQQHFKPSPNYFYDGTNCWNDSLTYNILVTDPQESRSMISRSRTDPIGRLGPASGQTSQGVVGSAIALNAQFGFNGDTTDEHSAQWTRPIQTCWGYYDQILESCLIPIIQR